MPLAHHARNARNAKIPQSFAIKFTELVTKKPLNNQQPDFLRKSPVRYASES